MPSMRSWQTPISPFAATETVFSLERGVTAYDSLYRSIAAEFSVNSP
jgi:hypothetical protein